MVETLGDVIIELGQLGLWIQAVGLLVVLWIIVSVITLYYNRKRRKLLEDIDSRVRRMEGKLNMIARKKARQ